MIAAIIFFVVHWYTSLFCQTFFHHRYASHQMFTMSKFWEKFFRIFSFLTQGSSYINPYAYGAMHRLHHEFADTEKDPHSPKHDGNLFKMMFKTARIYEDIDNGRMELEDKYKKNLPEWFAFDRFAEAHLTRFLFGALYVLLYFYIEAPLWMYPLLLIHFLMGPFHGAVINWWAHRVGYVNFPVNDTSKNFLPFDFLMLGESYHNNHHKFGGRANFGGFRWHEIDPTYLIILLFDKMRIIRLKKKEAVMA